MAESVEITSNYSDSFLEVLEKLNCSLVVTTYQAGKVIIVRKNGDILNTHFRGFHKPMGCASKGDQLVIGGANTVWWMRTMPSVAWDLEPQGKHDAAFLTNRVNVTGNIEIHEMSFSGDDLWIVNTRFSCLCGLADNRYNFSVRWRPHFVTELAAEDRCHLNGLAMRDDVPRYVTALGETNTEEGWRANKRDGGILMDVPKNKIILRGLSMPHSPRWHQDRLYLLNSGEGALSFVNGGKLETVCNLPGFTRGMDMMKNIAFVGLSQIRESVFHGLPITDKKKERNCGVWIIDLDTGDPVGFLKFDTGVEEIFAVQILPNFLFPEIIEWDAKELHDSFFVPDDPWPAT